MRSPLVLVFAALAAACSVTTTGNSITAKTQTKYQGTSVTKTANGSYAAGDKITIDNANGNVVVDGTANLDKVTVIATPFAFADTQDDGTAAVNDVAASIVIDESTPGQFTVRCAQASAKHGSAGVGTTGCDAFTVRVPAGAADQPLSLSATARNGTLDATNLTGSATITSKNGEVTASVTPTVGANVVVSSENGDVSLAVPADFKADTVTLTASGQVIDTDFPDVSAATSPHRQSGGASSIAVTASFGNVTLKKQ